MTIAGRKRLTYGDLVRMADDGRRHEMIEGDEFMTPPAIADHSSLVAHITYLLSAWILPRRMGRVFVEVGVYFGRHTFVQPDVAFLSAIPRNGRSTFTTSILRGGGASIARVRPSRPRPSRACGSRRPNSSRCSSYFSSRGFGKIPCHLRWACHQVA